jgi:hypothetical protein
MSLPPAFVPAAPPAGSAAMIKRTGSSTFYFAAVVVEDLAHACEGGARGSAVSADVAVQRTQAKRMFAASELPSASLAI